MTKPDPTLKRRMKSNRIKAASKSVANIRLIPIMRPIVQDSITDVVIIPLPFPPSANTYWRHVNGRTILSAEARAYRKTVQAAVGVVRALTGDLKVRLEYWYPDKRRRDIDNLIKQLLDSLVIANVMQDDCQITDLHVRKIGYEAGGSVLVTIEKI